MRFAGKVALVTGAGSGIGKAAALRLAAEGCAVGVLTHGADDAEAVAEEIRAKGGRALPLVADVGDETELNPRSTSSSATSAGSTSCSRMPGSTACGHPSTRSHPTNGIAPWPPTCAGPT